MEGRRSWKEQPPSQVASEVLQSGNKGSPEEVPNEAVQPSQSQSPSQPLQATFLSKATSEVHVGDGKDQHVLVLDVTLKNQEALQRVLINQEVLKSLIDNVQRTVSAIEEKVQAMEREMGTLSQFTQELNQVGDENNWA